MIPEQFMQYMQKLAEEYSRISGFPPSIVINGNCYIVADAERTVTCALLMELRDSLSLPTIAVNNSWKTAQTEQEATK